MGPKKFKPAKKGVGPMDGFLMRKPANQNGRRSEPSDLQHVAETDNQNERCSLPPNLQPVAETDNQNGGNIQPSDLQPVAETHNKSVRSSQPSDLQPVPETANQNGECSQPPDLKSVAEPHEELPSSSRSTSPLAQSRQGSSPTSSNPLDRQGEELHGTHNFEWSLSGDNKATTVSCNKAGGYEYPNGKDEIQSVIEFGYPLSDITERIVIQMVQRGRFDVLKEYLDCDHAHQQRVMSNLKNLVEGRNIIAFKNRVNDPLVCNDEGLKKFFEFFSQMDEPVPMNICN
ncbi:hypothetical protein CgunFtcFv8_002952 [Champsocephalus gunnari]|uniref:Uncharacterized protein n=1 Tax=Champsocephalus gunnari TaxID=52237 RepID=A0AAN8D7S4_CHAGU|nr:hypothetical protein CgunFtcFv8_002952 [Champsocephalus gunnari]